MTYANDFNRQTHTHTHSNGQAYRNRRNLADLPINVKLAVELSFKWLPIIVSMQVHSRQDLNPSSLVPTRPAWSRPVPSGSNPSHLVPSRSVPTRLVQSRSVSSGPDRSRLTKTGCPALASRGPAQNRPRSSPVPTEIRHRTDRHPAQGRLRSVPRSLEVRTETGQGLGRAATDGRSVVFECNVLEWTFLPEPMFGSALVLVKLIGRLWSTTLHQLRLGSASVSAGLRGRESTFDV